MINRSWSNMANTWHLTNPSDMKLSSIIKHKIPRIRN